MRLFYDKYKCSECGATMHLAEGATRCPFCGGQLYRIRSGAQKTARVCRAATKLLLAASFPVLFAALAMDSGWVCLIGSALLGAAVSAHINAEREARMCR